MPCHTCRTRVRGRTTRNRRGIGRDDRPVSACRRDAGTVVLAVAALVALGAVAMVAVAELTVAVVEASRARTAADASALAAVEHGPPAAGRLAAANGATLVSVHVDGDTAHVTVRVGRATASARATNGP